MNFAIIESNIIFFFSGILLGSALSIAAAKYFINRKLRNFYKTYNKLSVYNSKIKREQEKKIQVLKKIVKNLTVSKPNLGTDNYNTFNSYLDDLNQLLYNKGIAKIEDSFPPL